MLKQTVKYKDLDENPVEMVAHFRMTHDELTDIIGLKDRLLVWQDKINEPERPLTDSEVVDLVGIMRVMIAGSYGVREGQMFRKSPQLLQDFKDSGAFSAFLLSLFDPPENAMAFLTQMMPADLREQAQSAVSSGVDISTIGKEEKTEEIFNADREFTPQEYMKLPLDKQRLVFEAKQKRLAQG